MDWADVVRWLNENATVTALPTETFDFSTLIPWICESLNAENVAALMFWSQDELYQYAEEALHDIGGRFILIAEFDNSAALVADQALYPLPVHHIVTVYASANGQALKSSTVKEMEALDGAWEDAASGTVTRWIGDYLGLRFIRLYPAPDAGGTLELIYQRHPSDLTATAPKIAVPVPVGDYLAVKALEKARARQSDGQMIDAAQAFGTLGAIYERAMEAYWGQGS